MKRTIVALILFALPRPCADVDVMPSAPSYTFHTGNEAKVPAYYGKGVDRQLLVFCMHVEEGLPYAEIPVHLFRVFDDPDEAAPAVTP